MHEGSNSDRSHLNTKWLIYTISIGATQSAVSVFFLDHSLHVKLEKSTGFGQMSRWFNICHCSLLFHCEQENREKIVRSNCLNCDIYYFEWKRKLLWHKIEQIIFYTVTQEEQRKFNVRGGDKRWWPFKIRCTSFGTIKEQNQNISKVRFIPRAVGSD